MSTSPVTSEPNVGLIIREREPLNLEYPFDQLDEFLTPNNLFYIRSHFKAPVLDGHDYNLSIYGAVETPFKISYKELLTQPSVTQPATLECAGNGQKRQPRRAGQALAITRPYVLPSPTLTASAP